MKNNNNMYFTTTTSITTNTINTITNTMNATTVTTTTTTTTIITVLMYTDNRQYLIEISLNGGGDKAPRPFSTTPRKIQSYLTLLMPKNKHSVYSLEHPPFPKIILFRKTLIIVVAKRCIPLQVFDGLRGCESSICA